MLVAFSGAPSGAGALRSEPTDRSAHDAVRASGLPHRTSSTLADIVNSGHGFVVRPAAI